MHPSNSQHVLIRVLCESLPDGSSISSWATIETSEVRSTSAITKSSTNETKKKFKNVKTKFTFQRNKHLRKTSHNYKREFCMYCSYKELASYIMGEKTSTHYRNAHMNSPAHLHKKKCKTDYVVVKDQYLQFYW